MDYSQIIAYNIEENLPDKKNDVLPPIGYLLYNYRKCGFNYSWHRGESPVIWLFPGNGLSRLKLRKEFSNRFTNEDVYGLRIFSTNPYLHSSRT